MKIMMAKDDDEDEMLVMRMKMPVMRMKMLTVTAVMMIIRRNCFSLSQDSSSCPP